MTFDGAHDMKRRRAKPCETKARSELINREKFFLPPPRDGSDFKELFHRLASAGADRPADKDGIPEGPWTPDLLADAISQIDSNGAGVDLRTVQLWFQDNQKGISATNIRWLARVFGCDDPEATSAWQAELSAAQARLATRRREKRGSAEPATPDMVTGLDTGMSGDGAVTVTESDEGGQDARRRRRFNLTGTTESLFGGSLLNLPSAVFAGAVALGFSSYFLGISNVKAVAPNGFTKQVGFIWAPNWTLLFLVFMPLYFGFVADLLFHWKGEWRVKIVVPDERRSSADAWTRKVEASSFTFWAVFVICVVVAGLLQWVVVRLLPLLEGRSHYAMDWGSLAITHPEIISVPAEIAFTGIAYLYMCLCFYLFFAGLIVLYTVAHDLWQHQVAPDAQGGIGSEPEVSKVGIRVMFAIFRCTILSISVAICMKVQSAYLATSAENIVSWLVGDMVSVFTANRGVDSFTRYSAPNDFSSLILVLATLFVFIYGFVRIDVGSPFRHRLGMMAATVALLVACYFLIGAFVGFSILLSVAWLVATYSLVNPRLWSGTAGKSGGERLVS